MMPLSNALEQINNFSKNYKTRNSKEILTLLRKAKVHASEKGDSNFYNELILWMNIFKGQEAYLSGYLAAKKGDFYKAWCEFEKAVNCLKSVRPKNALLVKDICSISYLKSNLHKLQSLFPYKIFGSPEFSCKRFCTICKARITFRTQCEHLPGEIYNKEVCKYAIGDFNFLGMALVKCPEQKYSVPFLIDEESGEQVDHYDYHILEILFTAICSPFDKWSFTESVKNISISEVQDRHEDSMCPCGSETVFRDCCITKDNIIVPNIHFTFSVEAQKRIDAYSPREKPPYNLSNRFNIAIFNVSDEDLY